MEEGEGGNSADGPARALGKVGDQDDNLQADKDHTVGDREAKEAYEDDAEGHADVDVVRVVCLGWREGREEAGVRPENAN